MRKDAHRQGGRALPALLICNVGGIMERAVVHAIAPTHAQLNGQCLACDCYTV